MDSTKKWANDAFLQDVEIKSDGSIFGHKPDLDKIKEISQAKGENKIAFDGHVHGPYSIERFPWASEFMEPYKARFQEAVMPFYAIHKRADQLGLNAICVVGHDQITDAINAVNSFRTLDGKVNNLKYVIPGVEYSLEQGHFLLQFTTNGHPSDQDTEELTAKHSDLTDLLKDNSIHSIDVVRYLHNEKIIAGPAHPFSKIPRLQRPACYDDGTINYPALCKLNFVEVRNGFSFFETNTVAEKVYDKLEDKFGFDFKVAKVANSDAHIIPHIGSCFTTLPNSLDFTYNDFKNVLEDKKTKIHGSPNDSYHRQKVWFSEIANLAKKQLDEQLKKRQNPNLDLTYKLFDQIHGDKNTGQLILARMLIPGGAFAVKYLGIGRLIHKYYRNDAIELRDEMLQILDKDCSMNKIPINAVDSAYSQARLTDYVTKQKSTTKPFVTN